MICTLKDIALALNVSVNTVSHALKDKPDISEEMKRKVRCKAQEMGYIANRSAQFLRTGKTRLIAVAFDHIVNPYYSIMTGYIQDALRAENYNVMIVTDANDDAILRYETVQNILSTGADGIISFLDVDPKGVELIRRSNKYLLILGRNSADKGIDCITTDDVKGGYLATKHLIDKGHRDILIFLVTETLSCVQDRLAGYKKALSEAGIPYDEQKVLFMGKNNVYDGRALVRIAEERKLKYTAVFCFNDLLAFETITGLKELGKSVPQDVSVAGYDHVESQLIFPINLTTIDSDKKQVADVAVQVMLYKMENRNARAFAKIHTPVLHEGDTVRNIMV